jgi:hypothetical protein
LRHVLGTGSPRGTPSPRPGQHAVRGQPADTTSGTGTSRGHLATSRSGSRATTPTPASWLTSAAACEPFAPGARSSSFEDWQRTIVQAYPGPFLHGLFHSDGCRANNWNQKIVAGELKRYDYPRWQFTNNSTDIRELCCWALDLVDIPWRQSNWKTISVSTRAGVVRLDALIGPKS